MHCRDEVKSIQDCSTPHYGASHAEFMADNLQAHYGTEQLHVIEQSLKNDGLMNSHLIDEVFIDKVLNDYDTRLAEVAEKLAAEEAARVEGADEASQKIEARLTAPSPLDQFSIHPFILMKMGNFDFSFTNPSLFMLLTLGLVLIILFVVTKKGGGKSVPNAWQSSVELIHDFVPNLVNEQIGGLSGNVKQKFFPCILVTFTFSLFCNPQGMIPFSFTVTSHFIITLALSFSIFIGITIVGFQRHGLSFFSFFLPAGVPLPLAPFLVLLELISHCFRALSSGIRLFANMMAGHSLVKILSGFAWTMLFMNNIFYFIGDLGPLFIVLALTGLELGVAILQAHVSTISICIYLNDAINLHQSNFLKERKHLRLGCFTNCRSFRESSNCYDGLINHQNKQLPCTSARTDSLTYRNGILPPCFRHNRTL
nr:ATP synthase F0 subunit 6 [Eriocaulon alpestre]ULQ69349.1 ATP synthase F0 subunit 6 [Eriocaulon sp. TanCM1256]